jgi:hypothetical protein
MHPGLCFCAYALSVSCFNWHLFVNDKKVTQNFLYIYMSSYLYKKIIHNLLEIIIKGGISHTLRCSCLITNIQSIVFHIFCYIIWNTAFRVNFIFKEFPLKSTRVSQKVKGLFKKGIFIVNIQKRN